MKPTLRSILIKDALLLRRTPYPLAFMLIMTVIMMPISTVYSDIDSWDIKIGVVNEDAGYRGIRYSVFVLDEMDMNGVEFKNLSEALQYAEKGGIDALIQIGRNFSLDIHRFSSGNLSFIGKDTVMKVTIFSKYPQVKAAIASKIKKAYDNIVQGGENPLVVYEDRSQNSRFSYYSSILLISFFISFFYTLLFLYKDFRGPFYWLYFGSKSSILMSILAYILVFYLLSLPFSMAISLYLGVMPDLSALLSPFLIVLAGVSVGAFTSSFIKREFLIYYIAPVVLIFGTVASGILGPEAYVPFYLKLIYFIFPANIEVFYGSLAYIIRSVLISAVLLILSLILFTRRKGEKLFKQPSDG